MLAFLVFFPMIAAVISFLIGKVSKDKRDKFVIVACLIELLGVALMLVQVIGGAVYTASVEGFMYGLQPMENQPKS